MPRIDSASDSVDKASVGWMNAIAMLRSPRGAVPEPVLSIDFRVKRAWTRKIILSQRPLAILKYLLRDDNRI